eukprot:10273834-Alexandrium_andersonii.AAC.1
MRLCIRRTTRVECAGSANACRGMPAVVAQRASPRGVAPPPLSPGGPSHVIGAQSGANAPPS